MERDSLKIVVESNIPFFRGIFDNLAKVEYLPPEAITAEAVRDADALVTRTRTRCDAALLAGSRVSLVASATIGLDHVDTDWCRSAGVEVANAPGCNAPAVAQYVYASALALLGSLEGKTVGVVGCGHVGSIVADWGRKLGAAVLVNDPPRAAAEGAERFCSLEDIAARADIITFHTPMTRTGAHPTFHLFDSALARKLGRRPLIVNSARGAVTDTAALLSARADGLTGALAIDCWENEPAISRELLEAADIATPHIAGYSLQGKRRASAIAAQAVARHFGLTLPPQELLSYLPETIDAQTIAASYDPLADTRALRAAPADFEKLRNTYHLRREAGI